MHCHLSSLNSFLALAHCVKFDRLQRGKLTSQFCANADETECDSSIEVLKVSYSEGLGHL